MGDYFKILRFGLPYLRRYWLRFSLGVLFGFLFGMSNGLTAGGLSIMLNRMDDPVDIARKNADWERTHQAEAGTPEHPTFHRMMKNFSARINVAVDPWLPLFHRTLDWKQIAGGLLFFPLLAAIRGVLNYVTTYMMTWSGQRIVNDVKADVFRKISSLSLDFYHRHTTGELMSRISDDTAALNSCLRLGLTDLIKEPSSILALFLVLLGIDWKLTVIALAFIPLCIVPTRTISRRIKALGRQDNVAYVQQTNIAMESFQNVRVTKAYDLAGIHAGHFERLGSRASRFALKAITARALLNPMIETLNAVGFGAIFLYAVFANVPFSELGTFAVSLVLFYTPFKKLSNIQVYFTQAGLALERLMSLFEVQPTVREAPDARPVAPFARGLEFRDVGFSYGDGPVLEQVTFSLARGERLGLAGESGSGKSSLINLIFRFYDPTAGEIRLDGEPIRELQLAGLRGQMALVSQDVLLFNATVAENIGVGRTGATRDQVIAAAREAHAHEFISALPQGYDTPLGERGLRLSGGQRQRIAIARAFVRNAPILVLDEATASLDSQAEAEVQRAIDHLAENRTVICVAHRLSTLRSMDRILVLQKGRIAERGSFDELLAGHGLFAAMAARQSIFLQPA